MLSTSNLMAPSFSSSVSCVADNLRFCTGRIFSLSYLQKRHKSKLRNKKWPHKFEKRLCTDIALQHFDTFYKPVYGKLWPSMRVSLLTASKYCALLNNFHAQSDDVENTLKALGAQNGMDLTIKSFEKLEEKACAETDNGKKESHCKDEVEPYHVSLQGSESEGVDYDEGIEVNTVDNKQEIEQIREKNTSLYDFMPAEEVYTEREMLVKQEMEASTYRGNSSNIPISFVKDDGFALPKYLKFYIYERGNVSAFPPPKMMFGTQIGYYMMDAASLLPVIALDIKERDNVLDLCAAPGGKALAMLQTNHIGDLHCVDISSSRLRRLKRTLQWYMGTSELSYINVSKGDATHFLASDKLFNKVLVDVPCNTDRHVVSDEENNLFKPGRLSERLAITTVQRNLLVSGINACAPGGSVVYSTCTLSPTQNDGVVQAVLEHLWKETNIDVAVVDLNFIPSICRDIFKFHDGCRYGQLVLPSLSCNFGPMYIAKIKRLS